MDARDRPAADPLPVLAFADAAALTAWLDVEHDRAPGLWLELARVGSGLASVTYSDAVDVALCFGWVDGQRVAGDERTYRQRFTPRRRASRWSKVNRERVARLTAAGAMRPAGVAEVERARADGRWEAAYDPPSWAEVPPDLAAALAADPAAAAAFAGLDGRNRYAVLHRLQTGSPRTRDARVAGWVSRLGAGDLPHP